MNTDPNVIALRGYEAERAKSQADQERIDALTNKYQPEERKFLRDAETETGELLKSAASWAHEKGLEHGKYIATAFNHNVPRCIGHTAFELIDRYLDEESWRLARERAEAEVERDDEAPWLGPEGVA